MVLIVIHVLDDTLIDKILPLLVESEIYTGFIVEGNKLERLLATEVPIFAGLIKSLSGMRPYTKNIFAIADDLENVKELDRLLVKMGYDFDKPGFGYIFSCPITYFKGYSEI